MTEIQGVVDILRALGVASLFGPLIGLILSIWILKKTVFAGWGGFAREGLTSFISREKEQISVQTEVAHTLQELVHQLENLSKQVSEKLNENTDRVRTLEIAMSDYLDAFRELNHNMEMCRKNVPDTETFLQERKK